MTDQIYANNAKGQLNATLLIGGTSFTLGTGEGALFPSPTGNEYFLVTMYEVGGQGEQNHEILKVETRTGDSFTTVSRGQEGTSAREWPVGTPVEVRVTKGTLDEVKVTASTVATAGGVMDTDFGSQGLMRRGATPGTYSIVTDNSANWNTAFGWGDHAGLYAAASHTHDAADITTGTFANARISQASVTQHQAAFALATSQITSGTFADARIAQSNVTQHQGGLAIAGSQITGLTGNRVVITNGSGDLITTTLVTDTELGYLDGVTSSIQTQLNGKLTSSSVPGGDVSGTFAAMVVANDSHTHDTRYYTESEINTKLTDGSVTKVANALENVAGNWHTFINDGGGNSGQRWNATPGASSTLVENGSAWELETTNDSNPSTFSLNYGSTAGGIAGQAITWTLRFQITSTGGTLAGTWNAGTLQEGGVALSTKYQAAGSYAAASHTHSTGDITSGTFANARIAQSNVTQHEAALSIAGTQITGLTASRAVITNASGLTVSAVTSTELGYLDGVTSAIQTQLDGKPGLGDLNTWSNNNTFSVSATFTSGLVANGTVTVADQTRLQFANAGNYIQYNASNQLEMYSSSPMTITGGSTLTLSSTSGTYVKAGTTTGGPYIQSDVPDGTGYLQAEDTAGVNHNCVSWGNGSGDEPSVTLYYNAVQSLKTIVSGVQITTGWNITNNLGGGYGTLFIDRQGTGSVGISLGYQGTVWGTVIATTDAILLYGGNGSSDEASLRVITTAANTGNLVFTLGNNGSTDSRFYVDTNGNVYASSSIRAGKNQSSGTYSFYTSLRAYDQTSAKEGYIYNPPTTVGTNVLRAQYGGDPQVFVTATGAMSIDGTLSQNQADYAETFEWVDGNPDNEDRVGYSVVLVGEQVRIATADDDPNSILGIVSGAPAINGDSGDMHWAKMWQLDDFNRRVFEGMDCYVWDLEEDVADFSNSMYPNELWNSERKQFICPVATIAAAMPDADLPLTAVIEAVPEPVKNPDYDPNATYVKRMDRPEWDAIGLLGKLTMHKGQPVHPRWIKLSDINENLERWLVR